MKRLLFAASAAGLGLTTGALAQSGPIFVLDEIVFSAAVDETEAQRSGYSVEVIDEDDLAEAGDLQLTEYLNRLPGISLAQQGPQGTLADLRIRGARTRYISVYVDGILVTDPAAPNIQFDDFGGLSTGGIKRIEVLRGSQGALYGGTAVAGVINITTVGGDDTPMGLNQRASIEAGSFGTIKLGYGLTQRNESTILSFGLDHARADGFSAAEEDTGNTEEDGFDRTRLSFGVRHEVSDALTLGFNGFIEDGTAEFDEFVFTPPSTFAPGDGTPDDDEQRRDAIGLRAFAEYEAGIWEHQLSVALYRVERESDSNGSVSTFEGRRLSFEYSATGQVSDAVSLSFGLSTEESDAIYANAPGGAIDIDTKGIFSELVWSPSNALDVTATVRHDDHSAFDGETTGRLAFAYRPADRTVLRGAVSTGYRPPSIDELFGQYPGLFPFVGNPALQPEESTSYELGIDQAFASGATISATLFRLEIDNLVTFQPGAPSTLVNVAGTSRRQGLELAGSLPVSDRLTLNAAYTYTDAEDATGAPLDRVPEHDLVLGLEAMLTDTLSAGATLQMVRDVNDGGTPLDDYTVADLRFGYALADGVDLTLRVENVTGEDYQTVRGYGTSDRAFYVGLAASF